MDEENSVASGSGSGSDSRSGSYSDYSDADVTKGYINSRNRLERVEKHAQSDNESSDDIDSSDDDGHHVNRYKTKMRDDWIVDSQNRAIEKRVIEISAAHNQHLDGGHIEEAIKFFQDDGASSSHKEAEISMKVSIHDFRESGPSEMTEDVFERSCDRIDELDQRVVKSLAQWLMRKYFQNRDKRLEVSIGEDEDIEEEDDVDHPSDSYYSQQKNILIRIIGELLGIGGECKKTPQFIIKYRRDLYSGAHDESIFRDDDIYSIHDYCKKYAWILNRRGTVIFPVSAEILSRNQGSNEMFVSDIFDQADDKKSFDDIQRYCEYLHSDSSSTAHLRYFKDQALFGDLINQFLMDPVSLAVSISDGVTRPSSRDPPEPDKHPEDLLRSFLDEHPEFSEICENEAESRMAVMDSQTTDDSTPYSVVTSLSILEDNIVRHAAETLSVDPFLLIKLREQLTSGMVVSTSPTARGSTSNLLLPYGKYGPIKRIKKKPTLTFHNNDHWLLIDEARSAGLINVDIDYDDGEVDSSTPGIENFFEDLCKHYRSRYGSSYDALRDRVLRQAFFQYIWPRFKNETEQDLFSDVSSHIKDCVESGLLAQLTAAPFTAHRGSDHVAPLKSGCVLSFCWHPDMPKEVGVVLVSSEGNIDQKYVCSSEIMNSQVNLTSRDYANIEAKLSECRNSSDRSAIRSRYDIYRMLQGRDVSIDVVVIAATDRRSCRLFDVARSIVECADLRSVPPIIFAPADAALIYARSSLSESERRDISQVDTVNDLIIIAGSVARRVQNPLSELTRLCTAKKNWLVELPLHRFQHRLLSDDSRSQCIYEACERACLKAVAISGVDISKMYYPHHTGPLQFVSGLGPKWSEYIISQLKLHSGSINNRESFSEHIFKYDKRVISTNAISFIRFPSSVKDDRDSDDRDDSSRLLDGTLIHPDDYETAKRLIHFVLNDSTNGSLSESKMRRFFGTGRRMSDHLEEYCSCTGQDRTHLLEFIASELSVGPYESLRFVVSDSSRDMRSRDSGDSRESRGCGSTLREFRSSRERILMDSNQHYRPLSDKEVFDLLVDDSDGVLREGSVCQFRIGYVGRGRISGRHDSGVDFSSSTDPGVFSGEDDGAIVGTLRSGVIERINVQNMTVEVSFDPRDIADANRFSPQNKSKFDPNFDFEGEELAREQAEHEAENRPHTYAARNIDYKEFKNISYEEACEYLKDQSIGSYVVRPSTKGTEHLSLMIRFPGDAIGLFDIVERDKNANDTGIGRELWIDSLSFSELDEVYWNFVDAITRSLDDIMNHHRWVEDRLTAISGLRSDLLSNPELATYRITVNPDVRNCVIFAWIYRGRLIEEPVRLFGENLRYRHKDYKNIASIISYWKKQGRHSLPDRDLHVIERVLPESEEKKKEDQRRRADNYTRQNSW